MRFFNRSIISLGLAATLPTLVFATIMAVAALASSQDAIRRQAQGEVREVNEFSRAELNADSRVIGGMVDSPPLVAGDWAEYRSRAQRSLTSNPSWDALAISDMRSGRVVFGLKRTPTGFVETTALLEAPAVVSEEIAISGIILDREERPHVYLSVAVPNGRGVTRFVLTILKNPAVFQDILMRWTPRGELSAIVDRDGRFIARSISPETRIGRPGSVHLRKAVSQGGAGEYKGLTLEGQSSYTTYATAPATGWSAHVAYKSSVIDAARGWSLAVAAVGGLGALALAGLLTTLVLRDLAERRQAEEALRHAQKLEAVGRLTGGIAHDFNNLLTPIIGGLERIRARLGADERTHKILDNALDAARRAAKLTSRLLAFSRSQRMQIATIDLKALMEGMNDLVTHSVGPDVRVEIAAPDSPTYVTSDTIQLELALLNLSVNARDAMAQGGSLTIRTTPVTAREGGALPAGDYIDITVTDTGVGMSEEVAARALEPFFTTKPVGSGTGLGLSQAFELARQSGGDVSIKSAPGRGTTIRLRLPRAPAEAIPQHVEHGGNVPAETAPTGDILVVDDDAHVRAHIVDTLEAAGFRVVSAGSGEEALRALEARPVDLLLVDFAMPGMNGAEVIRAARERNGALKVLMVSGYSDSAAIEAAAGSVRVLRKPFDVAELTAAVTETIAA